MRVYGSRKWEIRQRRLRVRRCRRLTDFEVVVMAGAFTFLVGCRLVRRLLAAGALVVVLLFGVCVARAQYDTNAPWIDTNAMTVQDPSGATHSVTSEYGAFWLGFGAIVGFQVIGWGLRMVRWVGHNSPVSD